MLFHRGTRDISRRGGCGPRTWNGVALVCVGCVGGAVVRATLVPCVGVVVVVVAVVGATAAAVGAVARGLLQWVALKWW